MEDKRSYRSESKQKLNGPDRRSAAYRERDIIRDRYDDRDRERDRRYRSRSPRDTRHRISGSRDNRDERGSRYRDRRYDDRDDRGSTIRDRKFRNPRGSPRTQRYHSDLRARDSRRDSRSRSPEVEKLVRVHRSKNPNGAEPSDLNERIATPPVSFKVGPSQELDQMDVDGKSKRPKNDKPTMNKAQDSHEEEEIMIEGEDDLSAMKAMMGFAGFGTTHQKKVPGNNVSAVRKEKKTEYRQYMNRVGGFNRPLSPSHH